jgi:hypothetical protein
MLVFAKKDKQVKIKLHKLLDIETGLMVISKHNILVAFIYRSPSVSLVNLQHVVTELQQWATSCCYELVVIGDGNVDLLEASEWNGMINIQRMATRGAACLDVVLSSSPEIMEAGIIPCAVSDHNGVWVSTVKSRKSPYASNVTSVEEKSTRANRRKFERYFFEMATPQFGTKLQIFKETAATDKSEERKRQRAEAQRKRRNSNKKSRGEVNAELEMSFNHDQQVASSSLDVLIDWENWHSEWEVREDPGIATDLNNANDMEEDDHDTGVISDTVRMRVNHHVASSSELEDILMPDWKLMPALNEFEWDPEQQ